MTTDNYNPDVAEKTTRIKGRDVIPVFTPSDNHKVALGNFVLEHKSIHAATFKYTAIWDANTWNLMELEGAKQLGKVTNDSNILFTQDNGLLARQKAAKKDEMPFPEPFLGFAKAYITYRHKKNGTTSAAAHMVAMRALRFLYSALPSHNKCISGVTARHFDSAIMLANTKMEKSNKLYKSNMEAAGKGADYRPKGETTLYQTGQSLSAIATLIHTKNLSLASIRFVNPIPRPSDYGGNSHSRGTKGAKKKRAQKLPKTSVLLYLAALWNHYDCLKEKDESLVCMAVILLLSGFRMDEFVGLDIGCIPTRDEYEKLPPEIDPRTGVMAKLLRIRVMAKKSGVWEEKIVPFCAVDVIYEAVDRLKSLSEKHRSSAQLMLEDHKWHRLAEYDDDVIMTAKEVQDALGFSGHSTSNLISALKRTGVESYALALGRNKSFRVGDIHEGVCNKAKEKLIAIKDGIGQAGFSFPMWELLTLRFVDEFTPKGKPEWYAMPLSSNVIQDFFRGRDYKAKGSNEIKRILSVFERYNFEELEELNRDTAHTHQFRHLINTIMQESDAFSEEDIAKNFLRNRVQDNSAYNHQIAPKNYAERSRHLNDKVLENINISAEAAKDAVKKFPLLSYEELQQDLDDMGSFHFMQIGRCGHDYSQGPCGMHYMCLRNCINYKREKGNKIEITEIKERRDRALIQVEAARKDMEDDFSGANNWLENHLELVQGCEQALNIETDSRYQVGDIVQIFPRGMDRCEEADDE